jgi:hypothetical protein
MTESALCDALDIKSLHLFVAVFFRRLGYLRHWKERM